MGSACVSRAGYGVLAIAEFHCAGDHTKSLFRRDAKTSTRNMRANGHLPQREKIDMSYLDLLKLASPELIVVVTALVVLAIGLTSRRAALVCPLIAALGLVLAIGAVLMLPANVTLFGGMLVVTPLTSLFKIICLAIAFFTVCLAPSEKSLRNQGEYLAILLLAPPRHFICGRPTPIKARLSRVRRLSRQARKSPHSSRLGKSFSSASPRYMATPRGMRWLPAGRPYSLRWPRCRSCWAI